MPEDDYSRNYLSLQRNVRCRRFSGADIENHRCRNRPVVEWQNRPLDAIYPIVYLDCIVLKVRQDSRVISKAVFLALGINLDGQKELPGMWLTENEGAKFWLNVLTELKNRGLNDILIACVDGLKGFPEAINAVYPETQLLLCIVHMVRNSLRLGRGKTIKR